MKGNHKHGHAKKGMITRTYHSWEAMKSRCYDPNNINYSRYGAIGIKIEDPRWFVFSNFLEDMKECPEGMSLERKDNTKGYCKDNCKWATPLEQARNRKNTPMITYLGRTQSIAAWADELGFNYFTLRDRLVNKKWSVELAFTEPIRRNNRWHETENPDGMRSYERSSYTRNNVGLE
jgi:hypothetical protein